MAQQGACYIRVSTDEQTEFSPAAQFKAIQAYAAEREILLLPQHIYLDEGVSGKRADKRPAFMRMIRDARRRPAPFAVILVHRLDRFARSREDSVLYKSLLKREAGVRVVSVTEPMTDDKFSVILEAMLEAMAEYYSLNLADEVKKGMKEKALRGGFQAAPPLGYVLQEKNLTPHPAQAATVTLIFRWFTAESLGPRAIAARLNSLGLRTKRGGPFDSRAVTYILQNPVYVGRVRWTPDGAETLVRKGDFPPLVSPEVWEAAQSRLALRAALTPPRQRPEAKLRTWLKGLIYCGNCGGVLAANSPRYLQCCQYAKGRCGVSHCLPIERAQAAVAAQLALDFPGNLQIVSPGAAAPGPAPETLLQPRLRELERRLERLREAYLAGAETLTEYQAQKEALNAQRLAAETAFRQQPAGPAPAVHAFSSIEALLLSPQAALTVKHTAAQFLIERIVFHKAEGTLHIRYREPCSVSKSGT